MVAKRTRAAGSDTRSALLSAAAGLLEDGGLGSLTLRAVGARAGLSRQAPYRHFADKEALLAALGAGYFSRLGEEMARAAEGASGGPFGRLEAACLCYVRFALENPPRYRLMFGREARETGDAEGFGEAARAVHGRFVGMVAGCQEAGELPRSDTVGLAALLHATIHGAVELFISGHAEPEKGQGDPAGLVASMLARLRASA